MKMIRKILKTEENPIVTGIKNHITYYNTPTNLNYTYSFGSLAGIYFTIQMITGIILAMYYTAEINESFTSIVHLMTDVEYGWFFRYAHSNGASMIFILLYLHIGRGLYYKSYLYKRKAVWWSGIIIFVLMMGTAFIGYVLPWGQMSFWGATVITSLVTAIPYVGENIALWVWGGFAVSNPTLVRFFSLHYLLPFLITGLIFLHIILLHENKSTNPLQIKTYDQLTFHPYYTIKDTFGLFVSLTIYFILICFYPNMLGHPDNYIEANALMTPAHIVPEWYFTAFYALLRACPDKLGGVIAMLGGILIWFILPYSENIKQAKATPYSKIHQIWFWCLIFIFLTLLFIGGKPAAEPFVTLSRIFSVLYFSWFGILFIIPMFDEKKND